jgi:DHA1 family tetracycline resistance protein-like MFS transporter
MRGAFAAILLVVVLDGVGIGIVLPILPGLLRELAGSGRGAMGLGAIMSLYAAAQFVCSPLIGRFADRRGRRAALQVSLAGGVVDYAIMAWSPTLWVLMAGRLIAGAASANIAIATTVLSDITPPGERAARFGQMFAGYGAGAIAGPLVGGLLGAMSPRLPFLAAAVLAGCSFALVAVFLPETRPPNAAAPTARRRLISPFPRGARLGPLLGAYLLVRLAGQAPVALWALTGHDRFGWDVRTIGLSLAEFGVLSAISQALLPGRLVKQFGDGPTFLVGVAIQALSLLAVSMVSAPWALFVIVVPLAAGGVATPALQAMLCNRIGAEEQGTLQGALGSVGSLAGIVGPLLVTGVYAATQLTWPGFAWATAAALCLPAMALVAASWKPD